MKNLYWGKTIGSILIILLLMPLGHALMIIMEHTLEPTTLHYSAFAMGFVGLIVTICGVFVKGDTKQTCYGMAGALLFWTGWVEFLFAYYAQRYGVHCDLVGNGIVQTATEYVNGVGVQHTYTLNGTPIEEFGRAELKEIRGSRPEYLIMPASFGMWMMFIVMYVFCTKTGCDFIRWIQNHCGVKERVELRPMAHHPAIVTFMEWNIMMWGIVPAAHVLLRPCLPRFYSPYYLRRGHSLPDRFGHDLQEGTAHQELGQKPENGTCQRDRALVGCGDSCTQRLLQGDMGGPGKSRRGDGGNPGGFHRSDSRLLVLQRQRPIC